MNETRPSTELMQYVPQLSLAERDRRWKATRQAMAAEGLDCLLLWGNDLFWDMGMVNVRYLTQIASKLSAFVIFPLKGEPIVFTGLPHMNRPFSIYLSLQDWVHDIRVNVGIPKVGETLKELGYEKGRIGVVGYGTTLVPDNVTHRDYTALLEMLPNATFVGATELVAKQRTIKSAEEISMLEKAGKVAYETIQTMIGSARPGVRECELYADIVHSQISRGCEPVVFHLLHSGPATAPLSEGLQHLVHGAEPPGAPTMRPLQKDDLVVTEFHTSWGGYLVAAEFSVYLGKAPKELVRLHEVARECFFSGIDKMRPGVTCRELWEAFRKPSDAAGMDYVELGFHGHGLASPDYPSVTYKSREAPMLTGDALGDVVLQENMVFGTNIDMFDPRWRTDVGIMLGDTIQVTRDGPRRLINTPMDFPQKPV